MSNKRGFFFVFAGTVLLLAALSLFLFNLYEDVMAGQDAERAVANVQTLIHENDSTGQKDVSQIESLSPDLPIVEIDGYGYVGYLLIPKIEKELPVMSEWDDTRLKIAPCRHFGSSRTDDLVIAAHNYSRHFGNLSQLEPGDAVFFTDMDGIENAYEVTVVETLAPTAVETVQNSDHDLVLYTCTYGGKRRLSIFCDRSDANLVTRSE